MRGLKLHKACITDFEIPLPNPHAIHVAADTDEPGSDVTRDLHHLQCSFNLQTRKLATQGAAARSFRPIVDDDGATRRGRPTSPAASPTPASGPPRLLSLPRRAVRPLRVQVVRLGPYPPHPHRV
jgi:hypothetical protein